MRNSIRGRYSRNSVRLPPGRRSVAGFCFWSVDRSVGRLAILAIGGMFDD